MTAGPDRGGKSRCGILQRLERRCRREKSAQYDRPRHADALVLQIELGDGVLAQRNDWNAAEINQRRVLQDNLGHTLGAIAGDTVVPNAARNVSQTGASAGADGRKMGMGGVL